MKTRIMLQIFFPNITQFCRNCIGRSSWNSPDFPSVENQKTKTFWVVFLLFFFFGGRDKTLRTFSSAAYFLFLFDHYTAIPTGLSCIIDSVYPLVNVGNGTNWTSVHKMSLVKLSLRLEEHLNHRWLKCTFAWVRLGTRLPWTPDMWTCP